MEHLMLDGPAPTHVLLRLWEPLALTMDMPAPAWLEPALRRAPWVVVRRGYICGGVIPVGVRGLARHERFAAKLALAETADRLSPDDLTDPSFLVERIRREETPALAALLHVAQILWGHGLRWGPGGSVGFELATGVATATPSSDLDLILRLNSRIEQGEALRILTALAKAAAPARVDVMLETPCGGVALADLAAARGQVLVRTPGGVRLTLDPWSVDETSMLEKGHDDRVPVPGTGSPVRGSSASTSGTR